jgi:hypothetical protein
MSSPSFWVGFEKRAMQKEAVDIVGGLRKGFGAAKKWLGQSPLGGAYNKASQGIAQSGFGQGAKEMWGDVSKSRFGQWFGGQARQAAGVVRRNPWKSVGAAGAVGVGAGKMMGGGSTPPTQTQNQNFNLYGGGAR